MPKFVTISPTHIPGKKKHAWNKFKSGGYIAIGWLQDEDVSGKSIDEIAELIRGAGHANEASAIHAFEVFLSLKPGDYVAVNNTNHGLFGVGRVKSGYRFEGCKHNTGAEDTDQFYSHLIDVEWIDTKYVPRRAILEEGETGWQPYGAVGALRRGLPMYIRRLLDLNGDDTPPEPPPPPPEWLLPIIESIELLREDPKHQERAHESLVEDFFCAVGYRKHQDIKYRQGRVDITICADDKPVLLVEVKRDWDLSLYGGGHAVQQVYGYALDQGVRHVVVTNGDVYLLFDRLKGLSLDSNILGEFQLTALQEEDLEIIDRLRPANLENPNLEELFKLLSEAFS